MMATVPHVTSGSRLRKFQADGFFSTECTSFKKQFFRDHGKPCVTSLTQYSLTFVLIVKYRNKSNLGVNNKLFASCS